MDWNTFINMTLGIFIGLVLWNFAKWVGKHTDD